jgi:hypothetical protein
VNVLGKSMILWVIDSLKVRPDDALVIVYDPNFIGRKYWEPVCSAHPCVSLVELTGATRGAAETVLLGLRGISRALRSRPVMLVDGDTFYEDDVVSGYRDICATSNGVYYFDDTQPKPLYSYIVFDGSRRISQIKEKVKISDHANTGCYCFMRGAGAPRPPARPSHLRMPRSGGAPVAARLACRRGRGFGPRRARVRWWCGIARRGCSLSRRGAPTFSPLPNPFCPQSWRRSARRCWTAARRSCPRTRWASFILPASSPR